MDAVETEILDFEMLYYPECRLLRALACRTWLRQVLPEEPETGAFPSCVFQVPASAEGQFRLARDKGLACMTLAPRKLVFAECGQN